MEEPFAVTSVGHDLATNANAARALSPAAFNDDSERFVV